MCQKLSGPPSRLRFAVSFVGLAAAFAFLHCDLSLQEALGWGKGHKLIRQWAIDRLPDWQQESLRQEEWRRLVHDYSSLQDQHAGGNAPQLDRYCQPPQRVSLHDVGPIETSVPNIEWYLEQFLDHCERGEIDEALKFLGVLCHWNEDPGSPSAHSSPVSEAILRQLLPPPPELANKNYLYGYGGISDAGSYTIPPADYQPRLLGTSVPEAASRIYQHQRKLKAFASSQIVPLIQAVRMGDAEAADSVRQRAAARNARHIADLLFTAFSLREQRFKQQAESSLMSQPLTEWLPESQTGMVPRPYYVTPFLVNQAMDADRELHPLQLIASDSERSAVEHGFGTCAPVTITYKIAPGSVYDRFTARAGLHPTAGEGAAVRFVVKINGEEAARSPLVTPADKPHAFEVSISDANIATLELITIPGKDSVANHNLTVWAEPALLRAKSRPHQRQ